MLKWEMNKNINFYSFETYDLFLRRFWNILWRFWNQWYFTEVFKTHDILRGVLKPMMFYKGSETHGILQRFWNPWYFTEVLKPMIFSEVLKPMVFYGGSKTNDILEVLKPMIFYGGSKTDDILEVLKPMIFYGGSKTHDILEVLKPMIFYGGSKRLFLKFKKNLGNISRNGLGEETATLDKWLREILTLSNV